MRHEDDVDVGEDVGRDLVEVLPVLLRCQDAGDAPAMGSTRPRRLISPVMAVSARTGMPVRADTRAVAMAMPALGPSVFRALPG